jgi:A/G-specific adenine glycosylase
MATASFAARIVSWQRLHGRHGLPWQESADPYRVWLSEIMLQQTQVATVIDYYERFLKRFPTVQALAQAPIDDVLALWSGLGYYARARHLHACAQTVVQQFNGQFPDTAQALSALPGIGPSTAAAIAAFCFGQRAAILDGNVKRVLSRHFGIEQDIGRADTLAHLWQLARQSLPSTRLIAAQPDAMTRYTQGLMDLGATRCLPRQPRCDACPVRPSCLAWRSGEPQRLPIKAKRVRDKPQKQIDLLWLTCEDHVLLQKRPASGIWGALWCLPTDTSLASTWALGEPQRMADFAHELTHFKMIITTWRLQLTQPLQSLPRAEPPLRWVAHADLKDYGLPQPVRALLPSTRP